MLLLTKLQMYEKWKIIFYASGLSKWMMTFVTILSCLHTMYLSAKALWWERCVFLWSVSGRVTGFCILPTEWTDISSVVCARTGHSGYRRILNSHSEFYSLAPQRQLQIWRLNIHKILALTISMLEMQSGWDQFRFIHGYQKGKENECEEIFKVILLVF